MKTLTIKQELNIVEFAHVYADRHHASAGIAFYIIRKSDCKNGAMKGGFYLEVGMNPHWTMQTWEPTLDKARRAGLDSCRRFLKGHQDKRARILALTKLSNAVLRSLRDD